MDTTTEQPFAPLTYSIPEACEVSRIGRSTLYKAIQRGDLKAIKIGVRTLIRPRDLEAWIDGLPDYKPWDGGVAAGAPPLGQRGRPRKQVAAE
jgi:excisionase family DNA binding protein